MAYPFDRHRGCGGVLGLPALVPLYETSVPTRRRTQMKRGFTVIELVVSIAIAGLLGTLLLAAVNSARESARATHCRSNLLQLLTAIHSFESRKRIFPSAGWTFFWLSLSDRGTGENQPGSWIFNILPDLEQTQLATGSPSSVDLAADRSELFAGFARISIPNVRCPSKRNRDSNRVMDVAMMFGGLEYCSHSDYAMNAGSEPDEFYSWPGPSSLAESEQFEWPSRQFDGVGRSRYAIRHAEIRDGVSHTICIGEKRIYRGVNTKEDNQPMWTGFGADTC